MTISLDVKPRDTLSWIGLSPNVIYVVDDYSVVYEFLGSWRYRARYPKHRLDITCSGFVTKDEAQEAALDTTKFYTSDDYGRK